jgi:hypothetical protein
MVCCVLVDCTLRLKEGILRSKMAALIVILFLLSGCSTIRMSVTGYRNPAQGMAPGQSIYVALNPMAENPRLEKEVAQKISKVLQEKGFSLASQEEADLYLSFGYERAMGMVDWVTYHKTEPIQQYYPYSRFTKYQTIKVPTEAVVYQNYMWTLSIKVMNTRKLRVDEQEVVWTCEVVSEGRSSDLRHVLNYLIVGAFEFFGEDTGRSRKITLSEEDPRARILGGTNSFGRYGNNRHD